MFVPVYYQHQSISCKSLCVSVLTSLKLIRCLINGVYFLSCRSSGWCKAFSIMHKSVAPPLRRPARDRDIHHEKSSHPIIWSLQGRHATPTPASKSGLEVSNGALDLLSVAPPGEYLLFTHSRCVVPRRNFPPYDKYCMCVFTYAEGEGVWSDCSLNLVFPLWRFRLCFTCTLFFFPFLASNLGQ